MLPHFSFLSPAQYRSWELGLPTFVATSNVHSTQLIARRQMLSESTAATQISRIGGQCGDESSSSACRAQAFKAPPTTRPQEDASDSFEIKVRHYAELCIVRVKPTTTLGQVLSLIFVLCVTAYSSATATATANITRTFTASQHVAACSRISCSGVNPERPSSPPRLDSNHCFCAVSLQALAQYDIVYSLHCAPYAPGL